MNCNGDSSRDTSPLLRGRPGYTILCSSALAFFLISATAVAVLKQEYGGTLRVPEELLQSIETQQLFEVSDNSLRPLTPFPYQLDETSLTIDLRTLNGATLNEISKQVEALQESSHPCHWILDYPYFTHEHPTSISFKDGKLLIQSSEEESLQTILTSSCLIPSLSSSLMPFRKTQFGYEANTLCPSGRPFLDSITPVEVDPVNPYLSFKLNDVDICPIPEARFDQISKDPDIQVVSGPKFFLYLKTMNLSRDQVSAIVSATNVEELISAGLNGHAESRLPRPSGREGALFSKQVMFSHSLSPDHPYGLLVKRLLVQWKDAGLPVSESETAGTSQILFRFQAIRENNLDLFLYRWLREQFGDGWTEEAWYDALPELEASGAVVPLLVHSSRIAVRKEIRDLMIRPDGIPDFANCWLER